MYNKDFSKLSIKNWQLKTGKAPSKQVFRPCIGYTPRTRLLVRI